MVVGLSKKGENVAKAYLEARLEGTIEAFVQKAREAAEKEIRAYREQKLSEVEKSIPEIINSISREVLGRAMTVEDHADLVLKTLERAKKEKLFQ